MDFVLAEDFTFGQFLLGVLYVFGWLLIFWLVISVFADLFRRHDISGWVKAAWVILVFAIPLVGVLIYLITQHAGIAQRSTKQAEQVRADMRQAVGFSVADELDKLDAMKAAGKINDDEYARLRARLVE
jgi:hypothetical protein